jgi:purine-binding chemotaxis protein CheW
LTRPTKLKKMYAIWGQREQEGMGEEREMSWFLLCWVASRVCALPARDLLETLRPLPVEPIAGAPHFVRGVSVIRGEPLPVVDVARLLGADASQPARFVTLRVGERRLALAVGAVLGVRPLSRELLADAPALLGAACADVVASLGASDGQLLVVLRSARLLPESVWAMLEEGRSSG